jgi:hypothetical protein
MKLSGKLCVKLEIKKMKSSSKIKEIVRRDFKRYAYTIPAKLCNLGYKNRSLMHCIIIEIKQGIIYDQI